MSSIIKALEKKQLDAYMDYLKEARLAWSNKTLESNVADKIAKNAYVKYKQIEAEIEEKIDIALSIENYVNVHDKATYGI